jgi:hypothetical protein
MNYPPYPVRGIFYRIEQARANQNWNQEGERVQHWPLDHEDGLVLVLLYLSFGGVKVK